MTTKKSFATAMSSRRLGQHSGVWIAIALIGFVLLIAVAWWRAFTRFLAMPQRTVVMAVYPEGSLNAELAKHYREILARNGIELQLAPSAGAIDSVARMGEAGSGISVALIPGGVTNQRESPQLVSLGTLFYQPLWVFSRQHAPPRHRRFGHPRISIGPEGSSSRLLAIQLLGRAGIIDQKSTTLLPLTPSESAEKLIKGQIDVAIFLDAWESPVVQRLLNAKGITLESIARADAFVALYPYLSKLVLPTGAVNLAQPRPVKDVPLITTKSSLVVRKDLHPAIQYLLLEAAAEIHTPPGMFHPFGQFPAPDSTDLPLSPYAREFYKNGTPFLLRHLPFWMAVFFAQPVVWLLIPILVILIPLFRLAPIIYDWAEKRRIYKLYSELKRLEDEMLSAAPGGNHNDFIERLDRLKDRASQLSVPMPFKPLVYGLRLHIDMVRQQLERCIPPEPQSSRRREPIES
jgi:TRAP-type uncharacterized transport system substrate-binding protein